MAPHLLTADAVLSAYPEPARRTRRVRELGDRLAAFLAAERGPAAVDALVAIVDWLRTPDRRLPLPDGVPPETPPAQRRLFALIAVLERDPVGAAVRARLAAFLAETSALKLFAEAGLPNDRGLGAETTDRLLRRLLPAPRDDDDLAAVLLRLFPGRADLAFIEALDPDVFLRLADALGADGGDGAPVWERVSAAAADAMVLLAARMQGLGLAEGIRDRGPTGPVAQSPFFALPRAADAFLAHRHDPARRLEAERALYAAMAGCREHTAVVLARLESAGVSLDVVYTIEVIEQALARLETLLALFVAAPGPERVAAAHRLLGVLIAARLDDRSLRSLFGSNLHLLARKLVERAGKTGEHYITRGRREYFGMMARAAGGGVLTAFTAAAKLGIGHSGLAPFLAALIASANYSLSFLVIQLFGFTLATKQPSMTAAALAGALGTAGPERTDELVEQTARIVRSQLAAAIGNIATVTITAIAFDRVVRLRTGAAYLDATEAAKVIASFHPIESWTVWYAIVTGVILWAASLVGGWLENFAVCRRLPRAIAEHSLGRVVGRGTMRWLSEVFARQVSGFGVSVALGVMLGMTPALGAFFGLPLDVRHVTLSTGQLVLAFGQTGADAIAHRESLLAMLGIGFIFALNLGVSFALALAIALRARARVGAGGDGRRLLFAILRRFVRHPLEFFWPPRGG